MLTQQERLIAAIQDNWEHDDVIDDEAVDEACYNRLFALANDYGKDGQTAKKLLRIVKDLLS